MRRAVGTLGVLLPFMLLVGSIISESALRPSISAFYHAPRPLNGLFIGILCAIGVFLISYKGYERQDDERFSDDQVASAAGIGAILVAIFPLPLDCDCACYGASWFCPKNLSALLHYFGAAMFFGSTVLMLLYKFIRTYNAKPERSECECAKCECAKRACGKCDTCKMNQDRKERRNRLYRVCACVILFCLILLGVQFLAVQLCASEGIKFCIEKYSFVFWVETIAILAFGVAWFTKGEKDKECEEKKKENNG